MSHFGEWILPCCEQYGFLVAMASIFAFVVAFGIGANDVANAFATSVGAKSLTLKQAICIAAVCEFLGALLLGANVAETIRKGIVDLDAFKEPDQPGALMVGMMCTLFATAIWLLTATKMGLPVSTTHSCIGGIVGFALVYKGKDAVDWGTLGKVVLSWFASPILSAIFAVALFLFVRTFILRHKDSVSRAFYFYPWLIAITVALNAYYFMYKGVKGIKSIKEFEQWKGGLVAAGIGLFLGITLQFTLVRWWLKPAVDRKMERKRSSEADAKADMIEAGEGAPISEFAIEDKKATKASVTAPAETLTGTLDKTVTNYMGDPFRKLQDENSKVAQIHAHAEVFDEKTEMIFSYLQVFTAIVDSIGHGANDVANSIGPYAAVIGIYNSGVIDSKEEVPEWILAFGGIGITIGLALYGYKIIESIGVELIKVTPSRGFAIELGAAIVIVFGSGMGIPLSTTHCQVGAECGVGFLEGKGGVDKKLLGMVAAGWILTIVIVGGISALLFALIMYSPSEVSYEGLRTMFIENSAFNVTGTTLMPYDIVGSN